MNISVSVEEVVNTYCETQKTLPYDVQDSSDTVAHYCSELCEHLTDGELHDMIHTLKSFRGL